MTAGPFPSSPPFLFTVEGNFSLAADVPTRDGVRIFISRYVREWVVWHRAGCLNLKVCDIAAFSVAAIHCYYLDKAPWRETRDWLAGVFGIPVNLDFLELRHELIPEATLQRLPHLRPSTWTPDSPAKTFDPAPFLELLRLASPVEHLLVQGGDNRLTLDPNRLLNSYGCRPFPRPEAITFSSSTASSISKYAFDIAEQRRQSVIAIAIRQGVPGAAESLAGQIRRELGAQLWPSPDLAQIVLSSSGTDCFLIAQGLIRLLSDAPLFSLMVGPEESGAGVPLAAQERHFAVKASLGHPVEKGEPLNGCAKDGGFIELSLRDVNHRALSPELLDREVRRLTEEKLATGAQLVIHAMNHSKLGCAGPSLALLLELRQRFGDRLQVIIDACQMRLDLDELRHYLEQGFPVIVTGSKFFTGPPLSGAVLIPQQMVTRILATKRTLPQSFNAYCAKYDLPPDLREVLVKPGSTYNLGSYFRWVAAVAEIKRYFQVPAAWRGKTLADFCRKVEERLCARTCIELEYDNAPAERENQGAPGELSSRRMIFPFFLWRGSAGARRVCSEAEVRTIYTQLNQDCSERFEAANARDYRLLAQRCHIGQPVKTPHRSDGATAVLRLNVGARVISESWSAVADRIEPDLINDEIWQVGVVLDKIELLLRKMDETDSPNHPRADSGAPFESIDRIPSNPA